MGEARAKQQRGVGEFRTDAPSYDAATKVFRQAIQFRAHERIPSDAAGQLAVRACLIFRDVLAMNGLDDHKWPPDEVDVHGHADAKGMEFVISTRADKRKPILLQ